jgi:hypothetical protein
VSDQSDNVKEEQLAKALGIVTGYLHRAMRNVPRGERDLIEADMKKEPAILALGSTADMLLGVLFPARWETR